jgi:hypothetical protein
VRSRRSGPPTVAPYWIRCEGSFGSARLAYGLRERRSSSWNSAKAVPRNWLVPERVMTFTTPPEAWPYSALKPLTRTWISWIESSAGLWCA